MLKFETMYVLMLVELHSYVNIYYQFSFLYGRQPFFTVLTNLT